MSSCDIKGARGDIRFSSLNDIILQKQFENVPYQVIHACHKRIVEYMSAILRLNFNGTETEYSNTSFLSSIMHMVTCVTNERHLEI